MPLRNEFIKPPHLADAQRRLNIGHAIVVAEIDLLVVPDLFCRAGIHKIRRARDAVGTVAHHPLRKGRIVGDAHTPFPRRHHLHRMEAEDRDVAVAAVPYGFIPVATADGVRSILDDPEAALQA